MKNLSQSMEIIMNVNQIHTYFIKKIDQSLSVHGVNFSDFMVLYHLSISPEKKMRRIDLAEKIGLSPSGVTRLLIPMEKNHLAEKESHPRDARVTFVKISKAGQEIFENAFVSFEHIAQTLINSLNAKQSNQFLSLNKILLRK